MKLFFPDEHIRSAYDINYSALYALGYRGVIFDIDNTLVPHGAPATDQARQLFKELSKIGFHTGVLSNNKEPRVKSFSDAAGCDSYVYKANKPACSSYMNLMDKLGTTYKNTIFVGDQLFTDIWGANRCGMHSILTDPVQKWKEEPQIILKRLIEWPLVKYYDSKVKGF